MSSFAIVNLQDLEDATGGRAPGIEGRFARSHIDSRDLGVSMFRYAADVRSPIAHKHGVQEEAYIVVAGSGRVLLDGEVQELRQWDVVRVAPEVMRAFEAGPDGLDLVAVGTARPAEGDGEMGEAEWPDAA
jgi:quercetin dioxygenase-like cupin family protein